MREVAIFVYRISTLLIVLMLSSCSLLGSNQWSAYKITVEVQNEAGEPVENARLESNNVKTKVTNELGRSELKFAVAGLHVVTITAKNKVTKQIKISLPQDDNKVIYATLNAKR